MTGTKKNQISGKNGIVPPIYHQHTLSESRLLDGPVHKSRATQSFRVTIGTADLKQSHQRDKDTSSQG